ncbi:hypothetical protein BLNAU_21360 [Blattamonas nauphoetae]|uniref:Uncharacterized protein n=1 Tax=Blattamonas nauphoetae TaxID=2049346 RepID=A0ABQ9WW42_9EUKA|nr:hypothetical protein BLNAU_21360 [Blattamonas nauphoetae]
MLFNAPNSTDSDLVIDCELIPLAKQLIKTFCNVDSDNSTPDDRWYIIEIINISWTLFTDSLEAGPYSLSSIVTSAFDDMKELTSLLVESRQKFQSDYASDLIFLEKLISTQYVDVVSFLEHDLLARLFSVHQPQTVPLSNARFHFHLISVITLLLDTKLEDECDTETESTPASLCVERVVDVAKYYLAFILPKESCLELDPDDIWSVTSTITKLNNTFTDLEQYETQRGREVSTERELWETAWMTEVEDEDMLKERLEGMNQQDEDMRENETDRWVLRRRRLGECGFEDALEARTTCREPLETDDLFDVIHAMEKEEGVNFDMMDGDDSDEDD